MLQGERPLAKDNKKLGMFRLDGIPTAPKGSMSPQDMSYSLNSLKGGYIGDNIGDYYRAY